jgi:hypothetical protein
VLIRASLLLVTQLRQQLLQHPSLDESFSLLKCSPPYPSSAHDDVHSVDDDEGDNRHAVSQGTDSVSGFAASDHGQALLVDGPTAAGDGSTAAPSSAAATAALAASLAGVAGATSPTSTAAIVHFVRSLEALDMLDEPMFAEPSLPSPGGVAEPRSTATSPVNKLLMRAQSAHSAGGADSGTRPLGGEPMPLLRPPIPLAVPSDSAMVVCPFKTDDGVAVMSTTAAGSTSDPQETPLSPAGRRHMCDGRLVPEWMLPRQFRALVRKPPSSVAAR